MRDAWLRPINRPVLPIAINVLHFTEGRNQELKLSPFEKKYRNLTSAMELVFSKVAACNFVTNKLDQSCFLVNKWTESSLLKKFNGLKIQQK